jgi:hypothetical protein
MSHRRYVRTTLGDLIVAVTDDVAPLIRDRTSTYVIVSRIVSDLLAQRRVRLQRRPGRRQRGFLVH